MENQNVCKDCGRVKADSSETQPAHEGKVCKECNQAVQSGTEHEHKKEE